MEIYTRSSRQKNIPREIQRTSVLLWRNFIYKRQDEDHQIDIREDFLKSIHDQVSRHRKVHNIPCTIYRVPHEIRSTHPEAYTPMAVCIGPFFDIERSYRNMKQMEDYKWTCVRKLMPNDEYSRWLEFCLAAMKNLEPTIRASYSDEFEMSSDELVKMMLLDGCFILHLLLKHSEEAGISRTEAIDEGDMQVISRCWIWNIVTYDLLLLENQIPFIVIVHLFVLLKNYDRPCNLDDPDNLDEPRKYLAACGHRLFSSIHPYTADNSFYVSSREVRHLLHLFYLSISNYAGGPVDHLCSSVVGALKETPHPGTFLSSVVGALKEIPHPGTFLSSVVGPLKETLHRTLKCFGLNKGSSRDGASEVTTHWIPSAKELQDAGVKFKKSKNASRFLDIKFSNGVMEIPPLEVHDYSNSMFRNLIAFEQCYPDTPCLVTIYVAFMDCLLNTPEDARLLHLSGILTNRMTTDQDAAHFFSRLCNQVHFAADNIYLRELCKDVNKYQQLRWHKWRAVLVRDYFSSPWVIISFLAAIFLLLLTAGQTIYTIYPFYHK